MRMDELMLCGSGTTTHRSEASLFYGPCHLGARGKCGSGSDMFLGGLCPPAMWRVGGSPSVPHCLPLLSHEEQRALRAFVFHCYEVSPAGGTRSCL